eukprot:scaffold4024_cov75-Phaeocystis_antarctica.AAC.1
MCHVYVHVEERSDATSVYAASPRVRRGACGAVCGAVCDVACGVWCGVWYGLWRVACVVCGVRAEAGAERRAKGRGQVGSGQVGSGQVGSGQVGSGQVGSTGPEPRSERRTRGATTTLDPRARGATTTLDHRARGATTLERHGERRTLTPPLHAMVTERSTLVSIAMVSTSIVRAVSRSEAP